MDSEPGSATHVPDRPATAIESLTKIALGIGLAFAAIVAVFAYREHERANIRTLTGHVNGGYVTYVYPQSGRRIITAVRFMPVSLNGGPWQPGGEVILCGDVQHRFEDHHWVNVSYNDKEICAELESVDDVGRQERSLEDKEMCAKVTAAVPGIHLPGCDDQVAAIAFAKANRKYLASVGLDLAHDMQATGWLMTPVPGTEDSCFVARYGELRFAHEADEVAFSTYLQQPHLEFEGFAAPLLTNIKVDLAEIRAGKRRLILTTRFKAGTPEGSEERTLGELFKSRGIPVEIDEAKFSSYMGGDGSGVTSLFGSDVLLVAKRDRLQCEQKVRELISAED